MGRGSEPRNSGGSEEWDDADGWTRVTAPKARGSRAQAGGAYPSSSASSQPSRPPLHVPGGKGVRGGHAGQQDRIIAQRRVIVQGLTLSTTEGLLRSAFRNCGRVEDAHVARNSDGSSKGFGFIQFSDAGAAAMAASEGAVRIDSKLCQVEFARPREEVELGGRPDRLDDISAADGRQEVLDFVNRHEVSGSTRGALLKANAKTALRVVRNIEASHSTFSEGLIHSELQKAASSNLSPELESRVREWVADTRLSAEWQDRVRSVLLGQRPEEIEHVLEVGRDRNFSREMCSKDSPTFWLLNQVQRFRRQRTLNDIGVFCRRFGFEKQTEQDLSALSSERARRLMQNWHPAGPGTQKQRQQDFLILLTQALKERRRFQEERARKNISAVASHSRIIEEWSDGEDSVDSDPGAQESRRRSRLSDGNVVYAFADDNDDWAADEEEQGESEQHRGRTEQFVMHSQTTGASTAARGGATITGQSSTTLKRRERRKPKPTHFVLCVDTSGSMATQDCRGADGHQVSRLGAVLETCSAFVTSSTLNSEDVYSFVSFNERSALHFSCLGSFQAVKALNELQPTAEKQTFYAMGLRGVEAAIRRDPRRLPAHIVFLSDGEPTDPGGYIHDLQVLRRKHPGDALKIYTVGFGESAKVNEREDDFQYLQQLASLGRGHFQRCGASLSSLQGAFTAVTSTITHTRSSVGRRSTVERTTLEHDTGSAVGPTSLAGTEEATSLVHATIQEDSSEDSDDLGMENAPPWPGLASKPANAVEFELPHPRSIFKDLKNDELWKDFMAAQTSFRFDGHVFSRSAAVQRVWLRRKPFMQGGMRLVYGMVLESGVHAPDAMEHMMCAKRLFQDLEKDRGFGAHVAFCKSTAVAQYYARSFRSALERVSAGARFGFLDCQLYSPVGEGESGYHFCGESWLKGHFVKLNSNAGFVNEIDYSEHSVIAQAFSHFTFDRSHGELLVVDLQGICGGEEGSPYFLLTDPQVHSRGAFERFGAGDLGERGISAFFQRHKCSALCQKLGLRKEYDLRAPTHLLPIPGTSDCIKHMLGSGKDFFQQLRQDCKLSSIALPREAHSEWLSIRMWASDRGGRKAQELLQRRLKAMYDCAREVVQVQPRPPWTVARWRSHLDAWRRESGAMVIAFPPTWDQDGEGVQEIWVFSERIGPSRYNHQVRDYACQRIREALKHAQEEPEATQGDTDASGAERWAQYQDTGGSKYWYREPDGLWFWESDPQWQRFLDEANRSYWWWNKETGLWFYEPRS